MSTTNHSWALRASCCANHRSAIAHDACEQVWRGGSIGYMSPRHPVEGGDPERYRRWVDEVDTTLALQRLIGKF